LATDAAAMLKRFRPRLFELWPTYTTESLLHDVIAGVTVGLVALPLAMAFGIASGTTPQAGIYTAIVGGFLVSFLGGSRIQIGGPTGAFVVVAAIIGEHGMSGLFIVTMMAGVILLTLAVTGLGTAVKYIPRPIVIGFTNGIAVLIVSTQIKDFLGLGMTDVPSEFVPRLVAYASAMHTIDVPSVILSSASLAVIILSPRVLRRVPGQIVALLLATAVVGWFALPVETVGTRFGGIPSGMPEIQIPEFKASLILPLLPAALTVAILAAVESLLSAVVADTMSGDRHNSHAELMAQGVANLVVPVIGGIPVTGAIARTATNFRSSARSPVAGIVHALTLLTVVLALAPLARFVPMATLAAVLFAVEVGMALAALLYIYRVSQTTTVSLVTDEYIERGRSHILQDKSVPDYVSILRIHGPFLFGTTDKLAEATEDLSKLAPIVVLRLRNMTAIDATGLHALEQLADRLKREGRTLLLCGAPEQPSAFLRRAEFVEHIGANNILPNITAALGRAAEVEKAQARQPA
jgi:SulP family sulfate permease